nr:IS110 family transposase [Saccharothrix sp. NRRL B-16348]
MGERTVQATTDGHLNAIRWVGQWDEVSFAVEDCRHMTRRLEQDLLRSGFPVVRVHTKFMAAARRSGRQPGKSDPIDALAVAQAALREPNLPTAALDGPSRQVKLLSDHRHDLIIERTKVINRLRWHLHELDPALTIPPRGLRSYRTMDAVAARLDGLGGTVARIAGELLDRCRELTGQVNQLERELRDLARVLAPSLLEVPGCGVLSAAAILGETAGAARFRSKNAYARFTGTAPIPVWSGNNVKVRLNRGGNRTINHALHMIAVTQTRGFGPGKQYHNSLIARGKTHKEALRLLRRRLSDVVFRALLTDERRRNQATPTTPAAAA